MTKAIIMAGGAGTRLQPLTNDYAKPMVPFFDEAVLAHLLRLLRSHDITEIILTVHYKAEQIRHYLGDGRYLGVKLRYIIENEPLGTAGSVKLAEPYLDHEPFLVLSGDLITDINISELLRFHAEQPAEATMALKRVPDPLEYGVVTMTDNGQITQLIEKPTPEDLISHTINAGIYVLNRGILDQIPPATKYDFSNDIFPQFLDSPTPLFGYCIEGYWCDIGTLNDYHGATADGIAGKIDNGLDRGRNLTGDIWAAADVTLSPQAKLDGPIYLGKSVTLEAGCEIHGPAAIYHNTIVHRGAVIEQSIIGPNCRVGHFTHLKQAIVSKDCSLTPGDIITDTVVTRFESRG